MNGESMTSLQRVLTTLGHQEADRVPFFLLLTMHGAREMGLSIEQYFSRAEHVVEGQLKLRAKYRDDCIYSFFYAPIEVEAWGGEVIYFEDGPPNSGRPFIHDPKQISDLWVPDIHDTACLAKVLRATEMLKAEIRDEAPIIGVVMSPFSLPVMQMGFPAYIRLMYENRPLFEKLMQVNEAFCVAWANAQLEAGATAICYFDPVASTTVTSRDMYLKTGYKVAQSTISRINGPTATHMASGCCLPIVDDIAQTGTAVVGTSVMEDLATMKSACRGKLTILGNMNAIEMRNWTPEQAESAVKDAISKAGPGGGFILSDNHGEIPWQVPDEVLLNISQAVHEWGRYPLKI
ncbi:uroporphyrinogen decarboxylase [Mariprofundus ferrinatatus]|uniref:Uroporphyrinogen decarboxylase n=1 Tax=Mariprofundus ferrinatatus TaxID=1921087 RepID=A0A2K8L462_9PROT|nr:uroporphyrinogen decarboxylase family protein [Mariprofundus ferrinatatus]ATX82118.1 uroporphyrinogen decarboxylase [Mariprofundus ferrinatatus]